MRMTVGKPHAAFYQLFSEATWKTCAPYASLPYIKHPLMLTYGVCTLSFHFNENPFPLNADKYSQNFSGALPVVAVVVKSDPVLLSERVIL